MVKENNKTSLLNILKSLPTGYSEVLYNGAKYGITKSVFNKGKSYKIYAKELQGNDFVSLNYYMKKSEELLKPCEMSERKVIDFLKNIKLNTQKNGKL